MTNRLRHRDNLDILRHGIGTEGIDLVDLDPPFTGQVICSVRFRASTGEQARAPIEAFEDTAHGNGTTERAFDEARTGGRTCTAQLVHA
ncbi:MAG: site-specific DNA-methyltransferase, partial [Geminicoccaceae bacterium]